MTYRDDLINRLKSDGTWEALPADTRDAIEAFGDDDAREFMIALDEDPPGPVALAKLRRCLQCFDGALLDLSERPRVSMAGMLLAELVRALEESGMPLADIVAGLRECDTETLEVLLAVEERLPYEGRD